MVLKKTINEPKENYQSLALLEALNAFYQIRGLVIEESSQSSGKIEEALLELHERHFALIQAHFQEDDWKQEEKTLKLVQLIEEDIYRIISNLITILATTLKIKNFHLGLTNNISKSKNSNVKRTLDKYLLILSKQL